uniref:AraC family transcriptional regulator n=1 Tax=Heterorhabditis bacteriophora TaxID=37862 RepID=A0A1I7WKR3_HETBA
MSRSKVMPEKHVLTHFAPMLVMDALEFDGDHSDISRFSVR